MELQIVVLGGTTLGRVRTLTGVLFGSTLA